MTARIDTNLYKDWLKSQPSELIEKRMAFRANRLKTQKANDNAEKHELTHRVRDLGYVPTLFKMGAVDGTLRYVPTPKNDRAIADKLRERLDDPEIFAECVKAFQSVENLRLLFYDDCDWMNKDEINALLGDRGLVEKKMEAIRFTLK